MKKITKEFSDILAFSRSGRDTEKLTFEIFTGIGAVIGCFFIFIKLTHKILDKEIFYFDKTVIDFVHSFQNSQLTQLMKYITFLGGEIFLGTVIIVTVILLIRKHKKDAFVFGFILVIGIFLNLALKGIFQRARPDLFAQIIEKTYSFPSGHAMNSTVYFLSLTYFIFRNTRNKKLGLLLTIFSTVMVLLIGLSRIYLGVHYPSDVIGGYAAGLMWFVAVLLFEKLMIFLRLFKKYEVNKKY